MIDVHDLKKHFGENRAVKGVSFQVKDGEIFGLLGPNGAGKSTTIKMLVTILQPTDGNVSIHGWDVEKEPYRVRSSVGIIFQDPSLDERLTAWENLYFHSKLYHVPKSEIEPRINNALKLVGLTDRKKDLVFTFSGGMKRRLEIARGILHTPKVLFLDEPTVGLDPQTRKHIWEYLLNLRNEERLTMFLTTHYMEEAEICDRIAIMDHGEIIALDTPENLKRQIGSDVVTLTSDAPEETAGLIRMAFGIEPVMDGPSIRLTVENGKTFLPRLFEAASGGITGVEVKTPSLEDVFIKLTGRTIRDEEASAQDKMRSSAKRRKRR